MWSASEGDTGNPIRIKFGKIDYAFDIYTVNLISAKGATNLIKCVLDISFNEYDTQLNIIEEKRRRMIEKQNQIMMDSFQSDSIMRGLGAKNPGEFN